MLRTDFITDRRNKEEKNHWLCQGCGKDCFLDMKDYYMVKDRIWDRNGCGNGMICIDCLEGRMGRKLRKSDLTKCPLNYDNPYTAALLES